MEVNGLELIIIYSGALLAAYVAGMLTMFFIIENTPDLIEKK